VVAEGVGDDRCRHLEDVLEGGGAAGAGGDIQVF
jgi:hypothetical protein